LAKRAATRSVSLPLRTEVHIYHHSDATRTATSPVATAAVKPAASLEPTSRHRGKGGHPVTLPLPVFPPPGQMSARLDWKGISLEFYVRFTWSPPPVGPTMLSRRSAYAPYVHAVRVHRFQGATCRQPSAEELKSWARSLPLLDERNVLFFFDPSSRYSTLSTDDVVRLCSLLFPDRVIGADARLPTDGAVEVKVDESSKVGTSPLRVYQ